MKQRYILPFLAFMLCNCFFLFYFFYNQAKQEAIKNTNNQQLLYARQAARGIEEFFSNWTRTLTTLSELGSIIDMDEGGKQDIRLLYRENPDRVRAITRVDAAGRIIYTFPFNRDSIGRNISGQDHIRQIMRTHKPVMSNVFTAVQGYEAVALHVPVFKNNEYRGTIGVIVDFRALAKRYLEDIRIGNTGYAWVISQDGTELYCPVPGHTGKSVFENCKDFPSILAMAGDMLKGRQGLTTYTYNQIRGNEVDVVRKLAAYTPINIGNTFWSIVVASSEEEVIASIEGFRNKLILVMAFLLLVGVLFSYYGLKAWFIVREEEKRRRAEEALRENEENYRNLFQNAPIGIFHSLPEGKFLRVNPALARIVGYGSPEEMISAVTNIGSQIYIDSKKHSGLLSATLGNPGWIYAENRYRRKDGGILTGNLTVRKVLKPDGTVAYIEGFVEDVTQRKQAEESLQKSEKRFRILVEQAPVGVAEISISTSRFLTVNRRLCEMLGMTEEELLATTFHAITHPEDAPLDEKKRALLLAGKIGHYTREKRYLKKDGGTVWVKIRVSHLWESGEKPERNMITVEDITEHKRAEEEKRALEERLNRAEKMEALGTLAGGVAHDLNNVLGIVVGYSELLLDEIGQSSPMRANLTKIMEGGHRSAAIVQDLLTLARRGVQTRKVVNLNATVRDWLKTPEFGKIVSFNPNVGIRMDLEADVQNIMGSPVHVGKTIMNLVSNAVEAMAKGGTLTIRTSNRYLDKPIQGYDAIHEGDYAVLTVSDTGEGISDRDIQHIFEPFYTKKTMGRSGTGLGLAVVWGTVKDHNGYIDVQSEVGKGTTFSLYFPVTKEEVAEAQKAIPLPDYIGKEESILVVDDIKEQRELAAAMLGKLNYRVKTVSSGEEAVEYLRTEKADLLVLDMIMDPGMDGLDTYKAILETHPKQKAIIVSGFSETERVAEAKALGVGDYLRKPYVLERLGMAVRNELDRKQPVADTT